MNVASARRAAQDAIHAMRIYAGSERCDVRVQTRLYQRMRKRVRRFAELASVGEACASEAVAERVSALGPIAPRLGKDC